MKAEAIQPVSETPAAPEVASFDAKRLPVSPLREQGNRGAGEQVGGSGIDWWARRSMKRGLEEYGKVAGPAKPALGSLFDVVG